MLNLGMIDWVDCASVHILIIHLDFIHEHVLFFSVKLTKVLNFLR